MNDQPQDNAPEAWILADLDTKRGMLIGSPGDREAERAFWEAMFALPSWSFLAAKDDEALANGMMPALITLRDGTDRRMAPVFSSSDRASGAYQKIFDGHEDVGPYTVVTLPTERAVAYLCSIAGEIPYVLFDHQTGSEESYGNESRVIPGWYDQLVGPCPVECVPMLSRVAGESGHEGAFVSAYRAIAAQEWAYFIRTNDGQIAIANEQGKSFLPVFSTLESAQRSTEAMENVKIEACAPALLGPTHEDLKKQFDDNFLGVVFDPGIATLVLHPELFKKATDSIA